MTNPLEWCRLAQRHGIDPDIVTHVHDVLMKRHRGRWSKKIEAEATVKAVAAMRRLKSGKYYAWGGEESEIGKKSMYNAEQKRLKGLGE